MPPAALVTISSSTPNARISDRQSDLSQWVTFVGVKRPSMATTGAARPGTAHQAGPLWVMTVERGEVGHFVVEVL